jgi:predicted MarR family transcription regulator
VNRQSSNSQTGPIVSSAHLVSEHLAELSEFEFGLMIAGAAFNRWVVRCMAASGLRDLSALDICVVHSVNHRGRDKRLSDICFILNIEDTHLVNYALKKLVRLGLVARTRRGKEVFFATTRSGADICSRYRQVREACLIETLSALGTIDKREIGDLARVLRALSGIYDQAARAATSL